MTIATVSGIPIRLHWSFLAVALVYGAVAVGSEGLAGAASTLAITGSLFASVVLHELGHALAARAFGVSTAHITLFPFGGVAAITRSPAQPWHEIVIAVAGPLVNAALAVAFAVVWWSTGNTTVGVVAGLNLAMGLFNMLPAFPMDGGRVFRALLVAPLGYVSASRVAIGVGRVFAWAFVAIGLLGWSPSVLLVGLFLLFALHQERARLEEAVALARRRAVRGVPRPRVLEWRLAPEAIR